MDLPWRLFSGIVVVWVLVGFVPLLFWKDIHAAAEFANTFGFVNALFERAKGVGLHFQVRFAIRDATDTASTANSVGHSHFTPASAILKFTSSMRG